MRDHARLVLALAALIAAAPILSGCYTTQGAGKDLQAAGKSLDNSADRNTNYKP
nr:entericidin A/B family lipoprotein [uncultured Rhodopila sp.]